MTPRFFTLLLAACGFLGSTPIPAQSVSEAGEAGREEGALVISLSDARVSVVLDPGTTAQRRVSRWVDGEREPVELSSRHDMGVTTLERPHDLSGRLTVELILGPSQPLRIEGSELELTVEDRRALPAKLPDPRQSLEEPALEVALVNSRARLIAVRDALLIGDGSVLRLEATGGAVILDLRGGSAEVVSHRGNLRLFGERAGFAIDDSVGSVGFDLRGGELALRGSLAQATGKAEDCQLGVDALEGSLTLDANHATVLVRELTEGRLVLRGEGMTATLERVAAPLVARFQGGTLILDDYSGEARVQALAGARVEATGGGGMLFLTLKEEAVATVLNFAGFVKAEMTDATLDVEAVETLAATATRSRIEARQLGQLNRVRSTDTDLVLDLTGVAKASLMKLDGETRARIALSSPCVVRTLSGDGEVGLPGEAAEVTGCDLEVPEQAALRVHAKRRYGGQATVLNVEVAAGAQLSVEGN